MENKLWRTKDTSETVLAALMIVVGILAFVFAAACMYGLILMIGLGILHSVWESVPALAYWPCVGLMALFGLLTGGVSINAGR